MVLKITNLQKLYEKIENAKVQDTEEWEQWKYIHLVAERMLQCILIHTLRLFKIFHR